MLPMGLLVLLLLGAGAQRHPQPPDKPDKPEILLPSGKNQREEILKLDFEKTKTEAAELAELAHQLKAEIEKNERHVIDMRTLKKAEEIEKLARRIKDRMRRHY